MGLYIRDTCFGISNMWRNSFVNLKGIEMTQAGNDGQDLVQLEKAFKHLGMSDDEAELRKDLETILLSLWENNCLKIGSKVTFKDNHKPLKFWEAWIVNPQSITIRNYQYMFNFTEFTAYVGTLTVTLNNAENQK